MLLQVLKEPTKQKKVIFGGEDLLCCDTNMCDETGRVKGQVSENCIAKLVCESDCDVTNNWPVDNTEAISEEYRTTDKRFWTSPSASAKSE